MSYKKCCVAGCSSVAGSDVVLHEFPSPEKYSDSFKIWIKCVGGDMSKYSAEYIHKNRRICRKHFETKYLCRNNRLSPNAVPTLDMPCQNSPHSTEGRPFRQIQNVPMRHTDSIFMPESSSRPEAATHPVQHSTPEKIQTEPTFEDPLEVNQGYEAEVQQTEAVAYSTDNDDDYQPSVSTLTSDGDGDGGNEDVARRVSRGHATRRVTTQSQREEAESGPCWCCLKQGAHNVADIPAILDCLNVPMEMPTELYARVCSECENFLSRTRQFRDMVLCSQQVLSSLQRPVVQLDNSIEEDENATLRLEYVSETGQVRDMKVPLKDLYFDSSGHLVQYALEDNEESDDQESENDPKENKEAEVSRAERNKRPHPVQHAGPNIKRQRTTQTKNFTLGNNSPEHIEVRQSPGLTHNKNIGLRNSSALKQSNVQQIEVRQKKGFTRNELKSHNVNKANVPSKNIDPTIKLKIEQVDRQFQATASDLNTNKQIYIQTIEIPREPVLEKNENVPKTQSISNQSNEPPTNVGQTIELKIEQIDGQFVATTSNVGDKITLSEKTETHSPPKTKQLPVLLKPVRRIAFPNILRTNPDKR